MRLYLTVLIFLSSSNLIAQNSFVDFTDLFPVYKWEDLKKDLGNLRKDKPLNIAMANEYMWGKHAVIRIKTKHSTYPQKAPHYINQDNTYNKSRGGIYKDKIYFGDSIFYSNLYPLARVQLSENIILLILDYRTWDPETGWVEFYEAYTYRLSDEQLLSSLLLRTDGSKEIYKSFVEDGMFINLYRTLYMDSETGSEEKGFICKISYKLRDDGYFQKMESIDVESLGIVFWAEIMDKEGWVNIREKPDISSQVLFMAKDSESILLEKTNNSNWYKVLLYKENFSKEYCGGYILVSLVRKME